MEADDDDAELKQARSKFLDLQPVEYEWIRDAPNDTFIYLFIFSSGPTKACGNTLVKP